MDVNRIIDNLAAKFGTTVPYLIGEMQKYYIIGESLWVVVSLIIAILSALVIKAMIKKGLKIQEEDDFDYWEIYLIGAIFPGILCVAFCINFFFSIQNLLQWCFTPTAAALAEVLKAIPR